MNFSAESMSTGLNQMTNMIAETMETLVVLLDRSVDAVGKFARGVVQGAKKLADQFKSFLFADKEIILHKHAHHLMLDIYNGLKNGDKELQKNSHKLYGMIQEMKDFFEGRLVWDASYRQHFSFLYVEDIKPEMEKIVNKLDVQN